MARPEKVAVVDEVREKLTAADAALLTEYRGLSVTDLAHLRALLRPAGAEYKIYKNTLARRAAEEAGLTELAALLVGPTAIAFIHGDAVVAAKALRDYSRTNPVLVVKGGVLGTRVIEAHDVTALADVPPREVLLARIAGGFQAPLVKAAGLFQAFTRNMAYAILALIDQRIAGGEAAPTTEEPATEEPAIEEAATEEPVIEEAEPAAAADAEPVEAPVADAPVSETPTAENPADEISAAPEAAGDQTEE
jgi:large subunit ribosomal protein L10